MKEVVTAIYPFPWSASDPEQRVILSGKETDCKIHFFGTPVILSPPDSQPILAKKFVPLPKLGAPLINEKGQLFEAPHGFLAKASSPLVDLLVRDNGHHIHLAFSCEGVIHAPQQNNKNKQDKQIDTDSIILQRLVSSWVDIINEIIYYSDHEQVEKKHTSRPWSDITQLLLKEKAASEPRMALIVRIAGKMRREVADLAQRPRRILLRTRQMHRMERIQEVDSACLRWLVRQPGQTIPQKAGSKQELLSVVREDTYDTLENRVLKDFLIRCKHVAMEYLDDQRKFSTSKRYKIVESYKELCNNLLDDSPIADVQPIRTIVKPNYVLQNDQRYRRIWHWYQRLLRQEQEIDEAWTWQSRLWADISRLLVAVALTDETGSEFPIQPLAKANARFRSEQICGSWLISDSMPGPFYFKYDERSLILEFIDSFNAKEHNLCCNTGLLGGHFYSLITDIKSKKQVLIVFWSVHSAGSSDPLDPIRISELAAKSLHYNYILLNQSFSNVPVITGCVLMSTLEDMRGPESFLHVEQHTKVQTIQLPARPEKWHDALEYIRIFLIEILDLIREEDK